MIILEYDIDVIEDDDFDIDIAEDDDFDIDENGEKIKNGTC